MSWYDARRAEQDAKYAEANEQRARVFPPNSTTANVAVYAAPAMYEGNDKMDRYGYDDETTTTTTPQRKSSVQYNLDEVFKQLDRLAENIDSMSVRLSDVLLPSPTAGRGENEDSVQANSNLGSKLNAVAYRLQDYNQRLMGLTEAVDL